MAEVLNTDTTDPVLPPIPDEVAVEETPRPPCVLGVLDANLGMYQLQSNVCRGGRYVFTPPQSSTQPVVQTRDPVWGTSIETYLLKEHKESVDEFDARISNSFTLGYCREIIDVFVSTVFRQEVDRREIAEVVEAKYPGWMSDVDGEGHNVREFLRKGFKIAQENGWCGVLTDFPKVPEGTYASAWHAEQDRDKLKPIAALIPPTHLWDWYRDPITKEFRYAEVWQPDILTEDGGDTWKRWYPGLWEVVNKDGVIIDWGDHTFGKVPLDILICQDMDADDRLAPFGRSRIADAAKIEMHVYQMCSLLETHERKALFTFLNIPKEEPTKGGRTAPPDIDIGPSYWFWSEHEPRWVEPPASVPQEARAQLKWAVEEMRRTTGIATRSEESTEAHSGVALSWEYSQRYTSIYESAQHLEDFESRWWQTVGLVGGLTIKQDSVRYPKEYATHPVKQELQEIEDITNILDRWPGLRQALTPLIKRKLKRIAIADVGHLQEIEEILEAIDDYEAVPEVVAEEVGTTAEDVTGKVATAEVAGEITGQREPLNGAQVTAVFEGIAGVSAGLLPREAVAATFQFAFNASSAEANAMLGPKGFKPTPQVEQPADEQQDTEQDTEDTEEDE